jgi:hypothetical protein
MENAGEPSPRNHQGRRVQVQMTKLGEVTNRWKTGGLCLLAAYLFFALIASEAQQQPPAAALERNRHWQQMEWFYRQRAYPLGRIPAGARRRSLEQLDHMLRLEGKSQGPASALRPLVSGPAPLVLSTTQWTLIGPEPTNTPYGYPTSSGRVAALAVDPGNSSVVYLGAAEGGVWKSTDGGAHWTPLTDSQPSLAVGSIALDPSNSSTVYVGTGEENFNGDSYYGAGVLKSTNGGSSWTQLGASIFAGPFSADSYYGGGARIGPIAVSPANSQIVLAGVQVFSGSNQPGVYRSADGGTTWTNVLSGAPGTGVFFDPTNGNIAYAALGDIFGNASNGVYKSIDGGATWARADASGTKKLPTTNVGRIALAIAPSSTSTLFAGIQDTSSSTFGSLLGMFESTDSGTNWSENTTIPDYCTPQCWYDNVIAVDPASANAVFAGGSDQNGTLFRSPDGGTTWTEISTGANGVVLHVDHHALAFAAGGTELYVGNDGGVWSTSGVTNTSVDWTNLNATLAITQFYPGLSIHPTIATTAFAGAQDNGTQNYSGSLAWNNVTCGDGAWTAIDVNTPTTVYANCQDISIQKSTSSGTFGSWSSAQSGITASDRSLFIPPMVMDLSNPTTLYFGTYRVYQTTNGAGAWNAISADLTGGSGKVTTIAVAPNHSNTVYVGADAPKVQVTTNAGMGVGATWTDITAGLPPRYVTQIAVDPSTSTTAYVTVSGFSGFNGDTQGHVFKTINGGLNWTDISGNLPNTPVNDIVIDPDIASSLYVATDIGVFSTSNGGTTWSTMVTGLPRVAVLSLKLHRSSRTLRAATHGRSVWDLNVPNPTKKRRGQVISE